jgi:Tol biopolymer transport system component
VNGGDGMLALSPDGHYLAFVALTEGTRSLWLRTLDSEVVKNLPGTEDAAYPFWSPDSRNIAFFAGGMLKKIDVAGGSPQTICDAPVGRGGSWGPDGRILVGPNIKSGLYMVSAAGGRLTQVTDPPKPTSYGHRWPFFLPDGEHFLFSIFGDGLYAGSLKSKDHQLLVSGASNGAYADGYVFYVKEGTLFGQRFDPKRFQVSEQPITISSGMGNFNGRSYGVFSISQNGVLAYRTGEIRAQLTWFDRSGKQLGTVGPPDYFTEFDLSADNERLVSSRGTLAGSSDIWILDLARGNLSPLTHRGGSTGSASWSPDGKSIVFTSDHNGRTDVFQTDLSGAGEEKLLYESDGDKYVDDWSRDGKFVLFEEEPPDGKSDLWVMPMTADHKPFPYLQSSFIKAHARFSPDGRWVAYGSNESGTSEIYVESFPAGHGKWKLSNQGGDQSYWSRNGKELFYISLDRKLMAVPVRIGAAFEAGVPKALFQTHVPYLTVADERNNFLPSHDGQRFLVNNIDEQAGLRPITVVVNWKALVKR